MLSKGGYGFIKKKNLNLSKNFTFYESNLFLLEKFFNLFKNTESKKSLKSAGKKVINLKKKITIDLFGETVQVYNGNKWLPITVTNLKIGRSFKDFVLTKRMGTNIHRVISKKKNK